MASFRSQYGISLVKEIHSMSWKEFRAYMKGLDGNTPLGRIVSIRAEKDPEVLKNFTQGQRRIRSEWLNKQAKEKPQAEVDNFLKDMQKAFAYLAGARG